MLRRQIYQCSVRGCHVVGAFADIASPGGWLGPIATKPSTFHEYVDRQHRHLGPIFKLKLSKTTTGVFVSDPRDIRRVFALEGRHPTHVLPDAWTIYNAQRARSRGLLFMDGDEWYRHRKIMNKLLLKGDTRWIERACETACENLHDDFQHQLYKSSLEAVACLLAGSKRYQEINQGIKPAIEHLAATVSDIFMTTARFQAIPAWFAERFRLPRWRSFVRAMDEGLRSAELLLEMLARGGDDGLLRKMEDEGVDAERAKAIAVDLILAAADTTGYTSIWMMYLVGKHKDVQKKLRDKLTTNDMTYLRCVIKETLRLYPVAAFITRFLPEPSIVAGYELPANQLVIMSIYSSGRDARNFRDADVFRPERWERRDGCDAPAAAASLPFAMGARSCVGRRVAEAQLQCALAATLRKFEIDVLNANDVRMILKMVAVPSETVKFKLTPLGG